jgi:hypothetical protein
LKKIRDYQVILRKYFKLSSSKRPRQGQLLVL